VTSPFAGELQGMLDELQKQHEKMAATQREVAKVSATATAPKQAFKVTVGAQGEITEISFPTEAYRTMAPAELASVIKKTIGKARVQAAEEMTGLLSGYLPEGFSLADVARGKPAWEMFGVGDLPAGMNGSFGDQSGVASEHGR
jgi:DNA-binding protein YbaB